MIHKKLKENMKSYEKLIPVNTRLSTFQKGDLVQLHFKKVTLHNKGLKIMLIYCGPFQILQKRDENAF